METIVLNVEGISCNHCVGTIKEALSDLNGVEHTKVNIDDGTVEVVCDSKETEALALAKAIEQAGYRVAN